MAARHSEGAPRKNDDDKNRHDFKNQLAIIRGFAEILSIPDVKTVRFGREGV